MRKVYGYQTIAVTNTPQPVIGTKTTAAVAASPNGVQSIPVTTSAIFDAGQWAIIDVPVALGGGGEERLMVLKIVDGTHILCQGRNQGAGCELPHANGVFIRPSRLAVQITVQLLDGNAAPAFICVDNTGRTDGTNCIKKLAFTAGGTQPNEFDDPSGCDMDNNAIDMAEYWIVGTNPDKYLPSVLIL